MSSTVLEATTFILVLALAVILTFYNRRQAHALEYMARLEEDRAAREIQDRRELKAAQLDIEPLQWLESMVNPLLDVPLKLAKTAGRVIPEIQAAELRTADSRRLLVSTRGLADLRRYDRSFPRRLSGKGSSNRLGQFATASLLKKRWHIWNAARTLADSGDCFDLEAEACGRGLGLNWGTPTRLWFYVLPE
jgi:hypothetical protein